MEILPFKQWHEEAKREPKKIYLEVMQRLEAMVRQKAETSGWPRHDHSFSRALDFLRQRRLMYRDETVKLAHFWDIRNSLVHNVGLSVELSLVEDVLSYAHNMLRRHAQTAENFMTPFVVAVADTQTLPQTIKIMNERSFSQLPILHKNKIVALLTYHDIISLLGIDKNLVNTPMTIAECLKKLGEIKNNFEIIAFDVEMPEIINIFHKNPLIQAVIVTEHGQDDERPQGIIAPADFLSFVKE